MITASKIEALSTSQRKVYETLRDHGPLTDMELGYAYRLQHKTLDQAWSGLRTRRRELEDAGLVVQVGEIRNERNRAVALFGVR
jgi:hypothetical protein